MQHRFPKATVYSPDTIELQTIPGCWEAYQGLSKLEFEVCRVSGAKIIIAPEKVKMFECAPAALRAELRAVLDLHSKEHENALKFMESSGAGGDPEQDDPRSFNEDDPKEEEDYTGMQTFTSEEDMKAGGVVVMAEAKMHGFHAVRMLRDSENRVWLVARADSMVVPKWSILGGYGAGKTREAGAAGEDDAKNPTHFRLPKEDRTAIVLNSKQPDEQLNEDDCFGKGPETLYKVSRGEPESREH